MKKFELMRLGDRVLRVLEVREDRVLVIDCIKRTMPVWVDITTLDSYVQQEEDTISDDALTAEQKKVMQERYTMIVPVLSVVGDGRKRSEVISSIAETYDVSKQTVRKYLCQYLSALDITALVPKSKSSEPTLTKDEKNMRWALNKYFYTQHKNSLKTAYTMMLKEKYCSSTGELNESYPSFYQFRYFYRKTRKLQNYYISRNGLTNYQRNNRPLTGEGVQEFAPAVGTGMLDATVCDIYLVDDRGNLVGRPILTACIDTYSSLCCGYSLSWEGGVYSLRGLLLNIVADKYDWCRQFGISIDEGTWDCNQLPATLVTDMGSEYKSETFEQTELGVAIVNLPSYRPELKGVVEKFFDLIQETYKKYLKGKGVIEPDYQERGAHDYRKDACLTMRDFEKIVLHCIIYYNSQRVLENFPYTEEMISADIKPYSSEIWNWSKSQIGANLISTDSKTLVLTLLPRTTGKFSRDGLRVNKLRYHCDGFTEQYLSGGTCTVTYNPEDVSSIWLVDKGYYTEFTLIESRFKDKTIAQVQELQLNQKTITKSAERDNLQAQISLAQHIEAIASGAGNSDNVRLKDIRSTRKREQNKHHRDYMKEGVAYD